MTILLFSLFIITLVDNFDYDMLLKKTEFCFETNLIVVVFYFHRCT